MPTIQTLRTVVAMMLCSLAGQSVGAQTLPPLPTGATASFT